MHTEYYVNGQKSDLGGYLSAADYNEYQRKTFNRAKKYYKDHPEEWAMLCSISSKETIGIMMVMQYERTSEGAAFKEEWEANKAKRLHNQAGCGFFFYLAVILGCIIGLIMLS